MKTLKTLMVIMLILPVTFLLAQPVEARDGGSGGHSGIHGGHGGDHHGGHHHGHGFFWGFGYGGWGYPYWWDYPYWWNYPYYPYYDPYYYEGYGEPPMPPEGLTPPAESGQQQPSLWHFCQDPEGYYPYVKDCQGGWLNVVPPKPNAPPPATLGAPILPPSPPGKKPEK